MIFGISVYAFDDGSYKKYIKELGLKYDDVKDKAILYNVVEIEVEAENNKTKTSKEKQFDYEAKDTINCDLVYSSDPKKLNLKIAKITDKCPFGVYKNSASLIISEELFKEYKSNNNNLNIVIDSSNAGKLQDDIEETLKGKSNYIDNIEENAKMMKNMFILIAIFVYGFIIVISLIGVTNIFNTITTSMELRRQEFASLRSIGMTNREFSRMIRLESLFLGCKSLIIGIPIGIILSYLIYNNFNKNMSFLMKYNIPIVAILISIIVVFLLITIIMRYSLNKIKKQNIIETIRNENI